MGDLFRALSSGQLLVPHRFVYFEFDSYCIDDYAEERNFIKASRRALFCSIQTREFPETAVDDAGKLKLDFMKFDADGERFASKFVGRKVIRKCCPHGESMDSKSNLNGWPACRKNEGLVTLFFDQLQSQDMSRDLFFRFGRVKCDYPIRTTEFQLNSNGSLEIKMLDNSSHRLLSIEHYCLEDVVEFNFNTNLPSTSIYAFYCPDEEPQNLIIESEFSTNGLELTEPPFTTEFSFTTDPPLMAEPESTNTNDPLASSKAIRVPKCCPPGHLMHENEYKFDCHPLWWWPTEDQPIDPAEIVSQSLSYDFKTYHNVSSTVFVSNSSLSSCKPGQLQANVPVHAKNSKKNPIFRIDSKNQISLTFHWFVENYWDVKEEIQSFCVDSLLIKQERVISYASQVFHCITLTPFLNYRPGILLLSIVALLMTFVIYFFAPASGASKLILQSKGQKKAGNSSRSKSMAMVLTGRILLCHIISLSLAFTCMTISQQKLISSAGNSCVAIGYIEYWAFIASFSWLTVYCFDYYRIFSGSFKVSNDKLFIPYSAFGWGVPSLAMISVIIAQFQSTAMGISDAINPNMGYFRYWFPRHSLAEIIFFNGPVGALLSMDIYFFLSLMFNSNLMHCWQKPQETAIRSNRRPSTASKEYEDLKMATKLFFITGVPWIFEFFTYVYELKYGLFAKVWYFWEFSQMLNTLRGVFIFVTFIIFNRDVRRFLWLRVKNVFSRKLFSPSEDVNTATHQTDDEGTRSTSNGVTSTSSSSVDNTEQTTCTSVDAESSNEFNILQHE
uniref:G-protein coupled receptors family 2 profile 2 domain-containing protein n=1 Tax=Daphnia galeata TaxID=27404 RepID=A0A8J2RQ33_9CRUS|nr:unnamed protein product [Daphnia galeata]